MYLWHDIARVSVKRAGAVTVIRLELDRGIHAGRRNITLGYVDDGGFRVVLNEMQRVSAGVRATQPTRWDLA